MILTELYCFLVARQLFIIFVLERSIGEDEDRTERRGRSGSVGVDEETAMAL